MTHPAMWIRWKRNPLVSMETIIKYKGIFR